MAAYRSPENRGQKAHGGDSDVTEAEAAEQEVRDARKKQVAEEAGEAAIAEVADIDDLLADIDAVLEENAEEVVREYRQQGGQ